VGEIDRGREPEGGKRPPVLELRSGSRQIGCDPSLPSVYCQRV
jgi:hypothetical protein